MNEGYIRDIGPFHMENNCHGKIRWEKEYSECTKCGKKFQNRIKISDEIKLEVIDSTTFINMRVIDRILSHYGYDEINFVDMVNEILEKGE